MSVDWRKRWEQKSAEEDKERDRKNKEFKGRQRELAKKTSVMYKNVKSVVYTFANAMGWKVSMKKKEKLRFKFIIDCDFHIKSSNSNMEITRSILISGDWECVSLKGYYYSASPYSNYSTNKQCHGALISYSNFTPDILAKSLEQVYTEVMKLRE